MNLRALVVLSLGCLPGCSLIDDFNRFEFGDAGVVRDAGPPLRDGEVRLDSGYDAGVDTTPPTVVSASPEGDLIDTRTPIVVLFDEPILAGPSDFTLILDGVLNVAGRAEVSGNELTFLPNEMLATNGVYTGAVTVDVTDLAGNALATPFDFTFTLIDGDAGAGPRRLDSLGTGDVSCPHLAMDQSGNATAVFLRGDNVYIARYVAGAGWTDTELVGAGWDPALSVAPGGTIAVAYTAAVGGVNRVVARFAPPGEPLGAPTLVDEGPVQAPEIATTCTLTDQNKAIAVNDLGQAVIVWFAHVVFPGPPQTTLMNAFTPGVGWGTVASFEGGMGWFPAPGAAIDAEGNGVVTYTPISVSHQYRRYSATSGLWAASTPFEGTLGPINTTRVGVDLDGFITRAAINVQAGSLSVFARSETAAGSARPNLVLATGVNAREIYLDGSDGAYIVWAEPSGVGVSRFAGSDTAWQNRSNTVAVANPSAPVVAGFGDERHGVIAFVVGSAVQFAALSHLTFPQIPDAPDGAVTLATHDMTVTARSPRIAADDESHHGILLWLEDAATDTEIYAYSFHNLPPGAP